ncbi:maltose ABC transporter substrate-binding protein [Sporosarcina sp. YIM B06819]|uniref:sugar ABC transporter substrate-binding protein n=1 Tax=Sporosarcina sp. YIM B06819 TaxID=3081769 RepID=UPI00298D44CD|nr:maltose ABC transporter substrate-binding protein [Sporosarcina sp. YIM B06819]
MKNSIRLLFVMMLLVVLAACSKPGSTSVKEEPEQGGVEENKESTSGETEELVPEEDAELIVWSNSEGEEGEWIRYVAEKFTEEYGFPVKIEEVAHTDAPGKLQTDGPAGLGGDVFMAPHDHVGNMNTAGLIYENYFADEYNERFMESAMQGVSFVTDGELKTYGFPLAIETVALYHNKDLLDSMGFEPAATMDELIEQSKQFMEKNPGSYGFMLEPGNFYFTHAFLGGYGGYIFGNDNTNPDELGLNNEGAVKAGEFMKMIHNDLLPIKKEDITGDVIGSYFNEGKLLYNMTGPWALKGHLEAGVNLGITTMPKLENGAVPTTFSGVKALFVNSYSKYPKAATTFAKFATSDEMLLKRYEITNQLPPVIALLENKEIKENEFNIAFLNQAQHAISMPNIPAMELVWGGMEVAFTAIWNGSEEPKAALDKGTAQIREAIDSQTK